MQQQTMSSTYVNGCKQYHTKILMKENLFGGGQGKDISESNNVGIRVEFYDSHFLQVFLKYGYMKGTFFPSPFWKSKIIFHCQKYYREFFIYITGVFKLPVH